MSARFRATGYGFLNFFSTLAGGVMIYVGGALRDSHVDLSRVFQFSAVGLIFAALCLLAIRTNREVEEN